jgi:hypothetical protein
VTTGRKAFVEIGDGRSPWARRWSDLIFAHANDLGGPETLSEAQISLCRRTAAIECELESLEGRMSAGEPIDIFRHLEAALGFPLLPSARHYAIAPSRFTRMTATPEQAYLQAFFDARPTASKPDSRASGGHRARHPGWPQQKIPFTASIPRRIYAGSIGSTCNATKFRGLKLRAFV